MTGYSLLGHCYLALAPACLALGHPLLAACTLGVWLIRDRP